MEDRLAHTELDSPGPQGSTMSQPGDRKAMEGPLRNAIDLSVIIPALNEGQNLTIMLGQLQTTLSKLAIRYEILIVTFQPDDLTRTTAARSSAVLVEQEELGYGRALAAGFGAARGEYVLTMDADLSHPPVFITDLWANRLTAEIIIASRYVAGGSAVMAPVRYVLSRVLNTFFARGLSLPVHDMSSGFRLYRGASLRQLRLASRHFDVLQEILVRAYAEGWTVREIPFRYVPRKYGSSHARVLRFGIAYLRTFWSLWKLRNSILAADYDARAYDGPIPLQRYWQRSRFRHIVQLTMSEGRVLDVGCGSSRIIGALRPDSVALDILLRKLRYARRYARPLVQGSGFNLPFADDSFTCVLCSQVIEHVSKDASILAELDRVLAPGGRLVIGTPDYANWEWVAMEKLYGWAAPGAYADEHISHYSRQELVKLWEGCGYILEDIRYILRGEMILAFRKIQRNQG